MKNKKIGVAASVLCHDIKNDKILAGTISKDGKRFLSDKTDVTSDVLKAIVDYVGVGYEIEVTVDKKPKYKISVKEINNEKVSD